VGSLLRLGLVAARQRRPHERQFNSAPCVRLIESAYSVDNNCEP